MTRIATAFATLLTVIVTLAAPAIAAPISQAGWNERK